MLEKHTIPYRKTNRFSKVVLDYLEDSKKKKLASFYNIPIDIDNISEIIKSREESQCDLPREELSAIIKKQYHHLEPNQQVTTNIESIANKTTFTVTTAHQLNLFTGPLYYILKISNAINVANQLSKAYPHYNFIPVYWMGSEDHDFEEINHTHVFGKKIEWNDFQGGSVGEYDLNKMPEVIEALSNMIGNHEDKDFIVGLFKKAYDEKNLSDAVRTLLNDVFGKYGLVVVDGNSKELKRPFIKVIREDVLNKTSYKLVNECITRLKEVGFGSQANPRAINLFFKQPKLRERIIKEEGVVDSYLVNNTSIRFSEEEIIKEMDVHPERFSPNVILRPLHQQMILPNVAYIGGGSEVAYWLQLKGLFGHFKVTYPMLMLRTSAQIIDKVQLRRIRKLGFEISDLFKNRGDLIKNYLERSTNSDWALSEELESVKEIFLELSKKSIDVDASLKNWILSEGRKMEKVIENIGNRFLKAQKQKKEVELNQIDKLLDQFFPDGNLQERKENIVSFILRHGVEIIDFFVEHLDPFVKEFYLLIEEGSDS